MQGAEDLRAIVHAALLTPSPLEHYQAGPTAASAEDARRGCITALLTATGMGYPIDLRLGFRPVRTYRTSLLPDKPSTIAAGALAG